MKKIIFNTLHFLLIRFAWLIVKTLISTYRFKFQNKEHFAEANQHGAFIFAIWHESVIGFMSAHAWTKPYLSLSSRSKDGDIAAYISQKMGFVAVRGSSKKKRGDKGGKEAMEEYISQMRQGMSGGITVDGPKGPRHVCKMGVVRIAQQTGSPILPGVAIPSSYWTINSWDQFKIPKPFSTITIIYTDLVWVKADASSEEMTAYAETVGKNLKHHYPL